MARTTWRTVAPDATTKNHPSQPAAYLWAGQQPTGTRFRVEVNDGTGIWQWYTDVTSTGNGIEE